LEAIPATDKARKMDRRSELKEKNGPKRTLPPRATLTGPRGEGAQERQVYQRKSLAKEQERSKAGRRRVGRGVGRN